MVLCALQDFEYDSKRPPVFYFKRGKGDLASKKTGWIHLHRLHESWQDPTLQNPSSRIKLMNSPLLFSHSSSEVDSFLL